jgi:peptide deformylase
VSELPGGGKIRVMTRWGDPVMHAPCKTVTEFDADLAALVADLVATMHAADGVGLAANQVGVPLKVFVFDCPDDDGARHAGVVCNPRLTLPEGRDRQLEDAEEGCLSLPGAFSWCPRPDRARVDGADHRGGPVSYEGNGLFARCLQHESDHLEGTVFGDRLPTRARKKLLKDAAEIADEFPPEWPVEPRSPRDG